MSKFIGSFSGLNGVEGLAIFTAHCTKSDKTKHMKEEFQRLTKEAERELFDANT